MTKYLKKVLSNQPKIDYQKKAKEINSESNFIQVLQKELVQNAWSAVTTKSRFSRQTKNNWSLNFHLTTDPEGNQIFVITETRQPISRLRSNNIVDPVKKNETDRLIFNQDEHLNTHWINPYSKLIFTAASKDRIIGYENYDQSGQHHFGLVGLSKERFCEKNHHNGEVAEAMEKSFGLDPLTKIGSRIIIYKPVKSVVEAIENSKMSVSIAETWWPNIADHEVGIQVQVGDKDPESIEVPERFRKIIAKPKPKDEEDEKYYQKRNIKFKYEDKTYAIKHVYFGWKANQDLKKDQQGIFCFCNGQLVFVLDWSDDKLQKQAVGCIEFGPELSQLLSEELDESPIWKRIKVEIIIQMDLFNQKHVKSTGAKSPSLAEKLKQGYSIKAKFKFRQKNKY